ncbi:ROK family protein [Bacillus sp. 1P06AnD]|uniref:ROK family protein n=1 Tax=Bacillus sp. 1P06AnD TaxID=3132208 RepID=UPI0039A15BE7
MLLGAIEAGGTKFVCAYGYEDGTVLERMEIPTTDPGETMDQVIAFFKKKQISAIGIGSFGPVIVNEDDPQYGTITSPPKVKWKNYSMIKDLKEHLHIPIGLNTDVNVAALGEATLGAAKGLDSCLYVTVGTGIGGGAVVNGTLLQGLSHPEMGHILIKRHKDDPFVGTCPYHKDCLEGLASGPAIEERWGKKGHLLQEKEEVWDLEGYYLAQALMQYLLILSPKRIILGGGVMKQAQIIPFVQKHLRELLNGYLDVSEIVDDGSGYIVNPGLGDNAGITGALLLAVDAYRKQVKEGYM